MTNQTITTTNSVSRSSVGVGAKNDTAIHQQEGMSETFDILTAFLTTYYRAVLILVGLVGNSITIVIFSRTKLTHSKRTSFYLIRLAISDICFLLLLSLQYMDEQGWLSLYNSNRFLCKASTYMSYICAFISCVLVLAFTAQRLFVICFPLRVNLLTVEKWSKKLVAGSFVFAFFFYSFTWYIYDLQIDPDDEANTTRCIGRTDLLHYADYFNGIDSILTFIIPFFGMLIMNTMMIRTLKNSSYNFIVHTSTNRHFAGGRDAPAGGGALQPVESVSGHNSHASKRSNGNNNNANNKQNNNNSSSLSAAHLPSASAIAAGLGPATHDIDKQRTKRAASIGSASVSSSCNNINNKNRRGDVKSWLHRVVLCHQQQQTPPQQSVPTPPKRNTRYSEYDLRDEDEAKKRPIMEEIDENGDHTIFNQQAEISSLHEKDIEAATPTVDGLAKKYSATNGDTNQRRRESIVKYKKRADGSMEACTSSDSANEVKTGCFKGMFTKRSSSESIFSSKYLSSTEQQNYQLNKLSSQKNKQNNNSVKTVKSRCSSSSSTHRINQLDNKSKQDGKGGQLSEMMNGKTPMSRASVKSMQYVRSQSHHINRRGEVIVSGQSKKTVAPIRRFYSFKAKSGQVDETPPAPRKLAAGQKNHSLSRFVSLRKTSSIKSNEFAVNGVNLGGAGSQSTNGAMRTSFRIGGAKTNSVSRRVTKMLIVVSSIFLLLNLPMHSFNVYILIKNFYNGNKTGFKHTQEETLVVILFQAFFYTSFSCNFLLYSLSGVTFRTECKRLFVKLFRVKSSKVK